MKTRWNTEGTQTYFIISDLDLTYENAVQEFGFRPHADGFAKAYPTATPHLEIFYHHFARSAEEMILQRVGVHPVPWDQALQALLQRLAQHNLQWWLIGSAALAVRGLDIIPHDLDLIVDDTGAIKLGEILCDSLIGPVEDAHDWISTWFGRAFLHSRIEWAGGIRENVDKHGVTEFGPTAVRHLETITWQGYPLLVPPLDIQREVSKRRGLKDRVRKIEQGMLY
jgi:hypothetical protein